jgi:hypothetical protein
MVDHDDDSDEHDGSDHGHSAPAADPVLIALQLCALANNKTVAAAIKSCAGSISNMPTLKPRSPR